jgi:hypothetical protein
MGDTDTVLDTPADTSQDFAAPDGKQFGQL